LEFKNTILEEKLSKKYENGHENFSGGRDDVFYHFAKYP
jgi:hypothetical protein